MSQRENNTLRRKTNTERKIIERMIREGRSKEEIASMLYLDKCTIKREVKRGDVGSIPNYV